MEILLWPYRFAVRFLGNTLAHLSFLRHLGLLVIFGPGGGLGISFIQVIFFGLAFSFAIKSNLSLPYWFMPTFFWIFVGYIWHQSCKKNPDGVILGFIDVFMAVGMGAILGFVHWGHLVILLWPTQQLL